MLADIVYEGGRSLFGPLLAVLGAPLLATVLPVYGEIATYVGRIVGGALASVRPSRRLYVALLGLGYGLNAAIPLLALCWSWELAVVLYVAERLGKGVRAPVRDSLVAELASSGYRGRVFGVYELLDQVGAIVGPIVLAASIPLYGVRQSYAVLALPYVASMAMLVAAIATYPWSKLSAVKPAGRGLDAVIVGVVAATPYLALLHWAPASFRVYQAGVSAEMVAVAYAAAMAADAALAPLLGALYDKFRGASLTVIPLICYAATVMLVGSGELLVIGALVWGAAIASLETVTKAFIADAVEARARPVAFAAFYVASGVFWGLASTVVVLAGPLLLSVLVVLSTLLIAVLAGRMTSLSRAEEGT
jgi:MFS family permease